MTVKLNVTHTPVNIKFATAKEDIDKWNSFVRSCPSTSFYALADYLNSYASFGVQTRYLLACNGQGGIVGGAALMIFHFGPFIWIQVPHGPVVWETKSTTANQVVEAVENYAIETGAMFLQFSPFEAAPFSSSWKERADAFGLRYDPGILSSANIGVSNVLQNLGFRQIFDSRILATNREGQIVQLNVPDLLACFRQGTRRDINYSLKSNLKVVKVESLIQLQACYNLLKENAMEHNYPVRPWETFRTAIYSSIQNDSAIVLLAEYNSTILATIVVLFGGTRGYYVMGGTKRVKSDKMYPAHRLQYTAMQETLRRGYFQYDLTSIVQGGVADFKRGFRPIYYRLTAPYTKIYRPFRFQLYKTLYPYLKRKKHFIGKLLYTTGSFIVKK